MYQYLFLRLASRNIKEQKVQMIPPATKLRPPQLKAVAAPLGLLSGHPKKVILVFETVEHPWARPASPRSTGPMILTVVGSILSCFLKVD